MPINDCCNISAQGVAEGKALLSSCQAGDYSEGAKHVLSVIHEILGQHRTLESKWHTKKLKLHQRLALRLFQEDVRQVLPVLEFLWHLITTYKKQKV